MRVTHKDSLVRVKSVFDPKVKTLKEVVRESGRTRQFINQSDLTFGVVLENKETGDVGIKVVIADEKYRFFINYCKAIDAKKGGKKKVDSTV